MKKIHVKALALLLAIIMVLGVAPLGVFADAIAQAAEVPIVLLAGGDYQEAGEHANSAENVSNILEKLVSQGYSAIDGFLFVGDYDCETHDSSSDTAAGINSLMQTVSGVYPNITHDNTILVQGNHDYMDSNIDATGGHDFNGYSVFVLNEDDYPNGGGSANGVKALAEKLDEFLSAKLNAKYTAPIFITSHLPLAFGPRTNRQGDGMYAKYIFDVLNEAAGHGLNIIFLHGHDHAYGYDEYLGGEAIYLAKGDQINIAEEGSKTSYTTETLNFTYMNAGYTGYYNESGYTTNAGTDKLTMTTFEIYSDKVVIGRYSADGVYDLKVAGESKGDYINSVSVTPNTKVYETTQTVTLTSPAPQATISDEDTGIKGSAYGLTALDASVVSNVDALNNTALYTEYNAYSVSFTSSNPVTLYVPVPLEYPMGLTKVYSVENGSLVEKDAIITMIAGEKVAVFTVTSGGTYAVASAVNAATSEDAEFCYVRVKDPGELVSGEQYLIILDCSTQTTTDSFVIPTIMTVNSGSEQRRGPDIVTSSGIGDNEVIEGDAYDNYLWTLTASGSEWYIGNGTQNLRIAYNSTSGRCEITFSDSPSSFSIAAMSDSPDDADSYSFAIYDNNYYWQMNTSATLIYGTNGDSYKSRFYIYRKTEMPPPESTIGNWVNMGGGETTYNYELATSITAGDKYVIVASGNSVALNPSGSSLSTQSVTISGNTLTSTVELAQATFSGNTRGTIKYGNYYLRRTNGNSLQLNADNSTTWTISNQDNGQYRISYRSGWTTRYLRYSNSSFGLSTSTNSVRLYKYVDTTSTAGNGYVIAEGISPIVVNVGTSRDNALAAVKNAVTVYTSMTESTTDREVIDDSQVIWTWVDTYDGSRKGFYTVKVSYNDFDLGTVEVQVRERPVYVSYYLVVDQDGNKVDTGFVYQNSTAGTPVTDANGNPLYVATYFTDESVEPTREPLTLGMLTLLGEKVSTKVPGTRNGLTVNYQTYEITALFNLVVRERVVNNYPQYPTPGSVKVDKSATGVDFQASGLAQVELSASGLPTTKGVDVIIMVDTSSSMRSHNVTGTNVTRADVFEESFANLVRQFQTPDEYGNLQDIRVAVADFNGFNGYNGSPDNTPYDRDETDRMKDQISYSADNKARVFTGSGNLTAGAFVGVGDLSTSYGFSYVAGTNYDYAFDAVYQLGHAIRKQNEENGEERELFVLFMSDGAAMQWNYYHSQGASSQWNDWLVGTWDDASDATLQCTTHSYYYNGKYNLHRMAEAVKGDPSLYYDVIRKSSEGLEDVLKTGTQDNMYQLPGLGATMFAIAYDPTVDTNVTAESMTTSISRLATSSDYYYLVQSADELTNAFTQIQSTIAYAARNARFVDTMGSQFDIQLGAYTYEILQNGMLTSKTVYPEITVKAYGVYTADDARSGRIPAGKNVGDRNGEVTVVETVSFNDNGTAAYSNGGSDNILVNGVICAETFWYNTTGDAVMIDTTGDGVGDYELPAESFYWNIGTINNLEYALNYYVSLTDALDEPGCPAGAYPTNESAILYYTNYLGNECQQATVSPVLAWESALVNYAFYLVNEQGQPVNGDGTVVPFNYRVTVIPSKLYKEINLNTEGNVDNVLELWAHELISDDYTLYEPDAAYRIEINSSGAGQWSIGPDGAQLGSTYVTGFDGDAYSNEIAVDNLDYDYTHTTVWFAVLFDAKTIDDAVVIDYGAPVDVDVIGNDALYGLGQIRGISLDSTAYDGGVHTDLVAEGFGNTAGDFTVVDGKVRYTPKSMQMTEPVTVYYVALFDSDRAYGYYYGKLTVIPATIMYFEDSFVGYVDSTAAADGSDMGKWAPVGQNMPIIQAEDRIGIANNVYGYDPMNNGFTTYSSGSAMSVTVDAATATPNNDYKNSAHATFTFTGTGFDIISLTNSTTDMILITVEKDGVELVNTMVDNYYGYTYSAEDEVWTATPSDEAVWQVPVIKIDMADKVEEAYGTYTVNIYVYHHMFLDHDDSGSCTFILDAIRIYNPAKGNADAENAYKADGEYNPTYTVVKDLILAADNLTDANTINGVVFIDGKDATDKVADYTNPGPNYETYLANEQSVSFKLTADAIPASVQIGAKLAFGAKATLAMGMLKDGKEVIKYVDLNTATDMYYVLLTEKDWHLTEDGTYVTDTITLANSSEGAVISLTNLKFTQSTADETAAVNAIVDEAVVADAGVMMFSLFRAPVIEETEPETEAPTEPETEAPTEPETEAPTEPETEAPTEPETEAPTEPETEAPTEPETFEPDFVETVVIVTPDRQNGKDKDKNDRVEFNRGGDNNRNGEKNNKGKGNNGKAYGKQNKPAADVVITYTAHVVVTTSNDVEFITINGQTVTEYTEIPFFTLKNGRMGFDYLRIWNASVAVESADSGVAVSVFNANGIAYEVQ